MTRFGSWQCKNARTLQGDRRNYSSRTALACRFASAFTAEGELKNAILAAFRSFTFSHAQGQNQTQWSDCLWPIVGFRTARSQQTFLARPRGEDPPDISPRVQRVDKARYNPSDATRKMLDRLLANGYPVAVRRRHARQKRRWRLQCAKLDARPDFGEGHPRREQALLRIDRGRSTHEQGRPTLS